MRKFVLIIFILVIILAALSFIDNKKKTNKVTNTPTPSVTQVPTSTLSPTSTPNFIPPLDKAKARVTKKQFGTYITPQNSPVQPEKFTGYHTGVDLEIFPNEKDAAVEVHAVCNGSLLLKEYTQGYGGVVVQSCTVSGSPITVVYGHIKLDSITLNEGNAINVGEVLGVLGAGYSSETDGERKHLHLGFHKGTAVSILGYVQNKTQLSDWLDPCQFVCK
jgi:murein DD-endopeptidase MepM/ murein hydrolase activator NlpD